MKCGLLHAMVLEVINDKLGRLVALGLFHWHFWLCLVKPCSADLRSHYNSAEPGRAAPEMDYMPASANIRIWKTQLEKARRHLVNSDNKAAVVNLKPEQKLNAKCQHCCKCGDGLCSQSAAMTEL